MTGSQLGGPGGGAVPGSEPVGTCCFVLHSHLPWVAHASAWPVDEEAPDVGRGVEPLQPGPVAALRRPDALGPPA